MYIGSDMGSSKVYILTDNLHAYVFYFLLDCFSKKEKVEVL